MSGFSNMAELLLLRRTAPPEPTEEEHYLRHISAAYAEGRLGAAEMETVTSAVLRGARPTVVGGQVVPLMTTTVME